MMLVGGERLCTDALWVIIRDSIRRWEPPHDAETLTAAEQDRILENIREAFRAYGVEVEVRP
jgi:hypothetical protein